MDKRDIPWGDGSGSGQSDLAREIRIADEVDRQRAQREARRRLDAEERGPVVVPNPLALPALLALPRPPVRYRIDGWLPVGARAMLAAQFKSGKTTLVGNTIRSLVDLDPFLGRDRVSPIAGTVGLLDTEMGASQLAEWLEAQGIVHADRVVVVPLRGRVSALDLLDVRRRAEWAARLQAAGVSFLVLDCLRPVLDALGLDEHKDAGRFLVAFDALLAEAGISEALVVQHMGHTAERARGDSRLRDWPDVEWRLVRQDDDPASPRYLSAYGRDVDMPESRLTFDLVGRRLTIGDGSRKDAVAAAALDDVLGVLDGVPLSGRAIEAACTEAGVVHGRNVLRAAVALGIRTGAITTERGPRNAVLHRRSTLSAPVRQSAPPVRQFTASECASASIARRTRTLVSESSSAPGGEVVPFDPSLACVLPSSKVVPNA
jgi:hypothetical protein